MSNNKIPHKQCSRKLGVEHDFLDTFLTLLPTVALDDSVQHEMRIGGEKSPWRHRAQACAAQMSSGYFMPALGLENFTA